MRIIRGKVKSREPGLMPIDVFADRLTLNKMRWRGAADDGMEFGFDLQAPLKHGDEIHATGEAVYTICQREEPVLEVADTLSPEQVALLAWSVGNLHQPIEVLHGCVRMPDEPVLRNLLSQLHLPYAQVEAVFQPQSAQTHSHPHHREHAHMH